MKKAHSSSESRRKIPKCETCGKTFSSRTYLKSHKSIVHDKPGNVACELCNKKFQTIQTMKFHQSLIHKESDCKCNSCGEKFRLPFQLKAHVDGVHEKKNKCEPCDITFKRKQQLSNHTRYKHDRNSRNTSRGIRGDREMCEICSAIVYNLEAHIQNMHNQDFQCKYSKTPKMADFGTR